MLFRARLLNLEFFPGQESLEVGLFSEEEIPWESLSFSVVRETLRRYYQGRKHGSYLFQMGDITPEMKQEIGMPRPSY
jgi:hypothetical protein